MDNECSMVVKFFVKQSVNTTIQFVEANNHQVNAAKREIRTFKIYFIVGLCTVGNTFPLEIWCDLLQQAEITLNLLRTSRINKKMSAYAVLEGQFNFDKTPLANLGTKALVYVDPTNRIIWGTHAVVALYIGPEMEHYRCFKFLIPKTQKYRIAQTAKFFPLLCKMPKVDLNDATRLEVYSLNKNQMQKVHYVTQKENGKLIRKMCNIFFVYIRIIHI